MVPPEEPAAMPVPAERTPATPVSSAPLTSMQQADRAFAQGQYEEALLFYERVPRDDAAVYKHALDRIGEIRLLRKNYEGAIAAYTEILRADPSEYAAHNNLAAVYLATESYDQALDHLEQVLARKHLIPRDRRAEIEVEVRYIRATIYYAQFQKERDPITKREQGLLTMSVLRTFLDRAPANDPVFAAKRQDIEIKLEDTRQWVQTH
jgi:tetratricopeptide (TPR) repeat protein